MAFVAMHPGLAIAQDAGEPEPEASGAQETEASPDVVAGRHQSAGTAAAEDGDFILAETEFRAALSIRFVASTAADHAYALEQLQRYGEAVAIYDRLLALSDEDLAPNQSRVTLERDRREASRQQATVRVVVRDRREEATDRGDGQIIFDGRSIGSAAESPLVFHADPGPHTLSVVIGERQARASFEVQASELREVTLRFAPDPAEVAAASHVEVDEALQEEQRIADTRSNAVYWILGGALLVAGAVILGLALRPSSGEEDALPVWQALTPSPR